MRTEYIERVLAYLIKSAETDEEHKAQVKILSMLKQLTDGVVFSNDFLLIKMISNLYRVKISLGYTDITLDHDDILRQMESEIKTLVFLPEFDLKKAVFEAELPLDMNNPADMQEIISTFFMRFTDSIDRVFELEVNPAQAALELNALKNLMIDELYREKIVVTSKSYNELGVTVSMEKGLAFDAKIRYLQNCNTTGELEVAEEFYIDSYEGYLKVKQSTKHVVRDLYKMGYQPFDDKFTITSGDIVVLVAETNAGKTRLIFDQVYRALVSGVNVSFVPSETENEKVLSKLVLRHMFSLFKYTKLPINPELLETNEDFRLSNEELYADILDKYRFAERDLWGNKKTGKLHVVNNFYYEDCAEEFSNFKNKIGSDIVFIDHSRALRSKGTKVLGKFLSNQKEQLAYLASCVREAKMGHNLAFFITSHPSSEGSSDLASGRIKASPNLTAGARELSEVATRMFYLSQTLEGEVLDTVSIHEGKTRTEAKIRKPLILKRWGDCNAHTYEESYQQEDNTTDTIGELTDV